MRHSIESILVVDDDDDTRDVLITLLEAEGYRVRAASDALGALAILRSERIALILLDLMMPGMTGGELRGQQLADPALAAIPVIAVTGDTTAVIDNLLMVRKPFDSTYLLGAIRNELDHAESTRHRELLATASDVRKKMAKTIGDLAAVRRASSPEVEPPSRRRR